MTLNKQTTVSMERERQSFTVLISFMLVLWHWMCPRTQLSTSISCSSELHSVVPTHTWLRSALCERGVGDGSEWLDNVRALFVKGVTSHFKQAQKQGLAPFLSPGHYSDCLSSLENSRDLRWSSRRARPGLSFTGFLKVSHPLAVRFSVEWSHWSHFCKSFSPALITSVPCILCFSRLTYYLIAEELTFF